MEAAELGDVCLATILVGDDPASHVYIDAKHRAAHEANIETRDYRLPTDTSEADVLAAVEEVNADDAVDGLLVQLPLPEQVDEVRVTHAVAPIKDVDGFHPVNAGHLYLGHAAPRSRHRRGRDRAAARPTTCRSPARRQS